MSFTLSVLGGLFITAYCFSRVKARREEKSSAQTLFKTK